MPWPPNPLANARNSPQLVYSRKIATDPSVILDRAGGAGDVVLAIKPGTWLKRGDQFVTIDELGVGNYVKVEAIQIPGQELQQITVLGVGREGGD
jgi:hypothetical protein